LKTIPFNPLPTSIGVIKYDIFLSVVMVSNFYDWFIVFGSNFFGERIAGTVFVNVSIQIYYNLLILIT